MSIDEIFAQASPDDSVGGAVPSFGYLTEMLQTELRGADGDAGSEVPGPVDVDTIARGDDSQDKKKTVVRPKR